MNITLHACCNPPVYSRN